MTKVVRALFFTGGLFSGFILTYYGLWPLEVLIQRPLTPVESVGLVGLGTALGGLVGYALAPWLFRQTVDALGWLVGRVVRLPTPDLVAGSLGLILGLLIASLSATALAALPLVGQPLAVASYVVLGYLGLAVGARKREELMALVSSLPRRGGKDRSARVRGAAPKILDTSAIIDGRIADVVRAGFIEGTLVIPGFVLEELRRVADSSDVLKRNRGRRGLDVLNRIQKELEAEVELVERDPAPNHDVDTKLVRVARQLGGKIVTNDYNLNKVAGLHGVPVLNLNELANALKPVVLPGEDMTVQVIKDGKEAGQGVAYLDDGTMIVVDGGKRHIGETIGVTVTSVLQTAAGRMIFAKPKTMEKAM